MPTWGSARIAWRSNDRLVALIARGHDIVTDTLALTVASAWSPRRPRPSPVFRNFSLVDAFPVSPGHSLAVPRRHEANYLALPSADQQANVRWRRL